MEQTKGSLLPALSNFSVQYNFQAASAVLALLTFEPHVESSAEHLVRTHSVALVGAVFGMLALGFVADRVGLRLATLTTHSLVIVGALGCAAFPLRRDFGLMLLGRFILGIGVGGLYPISAVSASTGSRPVQSAAWAFFWQGPGSVSPYILALLLPMHPTSAGTLILMLGAVPAAVVLSASTSKEPSTARPQFRREVVAGSAKSLLGTAGSWFLYDVLFYGTALFVPEMLQVLLGKSENPASVLGRTAIVVALMIPGPYLTACVMGESLERLAVIQAISFGFQTLAFLTCAGAVHWQASPNVACACIGLLLFSLSWGTVVTTYVLPTILFPSEVRTTMHGASAAAGKVGAAVGAVVFLPVQQAIGLAGLMAVQGCIAGCAVAFSLWALWDSSPENAPLKRKDADPELFGLRESPME